MNKIVNGDCIEEMKKMKSNSVDSIVTDPPYLLNFMGKEWDSTGITNNVEMWKEALRVLKPGGHLIAFSGTRTYHRMACAVEDAGFEVRDMMQWIYGSGMPHGQDIGRFVESRKGWNTYLKPANEPMVLARKPLSERTVADNVMRWGTGGINIDGTRVPLNGEKNLSITRYQSALQHGNNGWNNVNSEANFNEVKKASMEQGRFPSNVILDETAAAMLDKQSGTLKSGSNCKRTKEGKFLEHGGLGKAGDVQVTYGDKGGASRFFYCVKASRKERDMGLDNMNTVVCGALQGRHDGSLGSKTMGKNDHTTVKPVKLMEYLVTLVTPPNGVVLDPFAGSGTTGIAAKNKGFDFIGIERDAHYCEIARRRID